MLRRRPCSLALSALSALAVTLAGFTTPSAAADQTARSKITAVTVFPRGALIKRTASASLQPGATTLIIKDLPESVVRGSIRVEGRAQNDVAIGSVDSRVQVITADDQKRLAARRAELDAELIRVRDRRAATQAAIDTAQTQRSLMVNLTQLPQQPAPRGTATTDWKALFDLIGTGMAQAQETIGTKLVELRKLDDQIKQLEAQLATMVPKQTRATVVSVNVLSDSGGEATFTVRYQVRNASWQPFYDARLTTGGATQAPSLALVRRARIEQRTGEDWDGVALSLSTTRPAQGTQAPKLRALSVDFYRPPSRPTPRAMSRGLSADQVQPAPRVAASMPRRKSRRVLARAVQVQRSPFQVVYAIPGLNTVPATGAPKRVSIGTQQLTPTLFAMATPRQRTKAYLHAKLALPTGAPFLAGPVSLFRDGTFVGRARLPNLTGGQEHRLGFGSDDAIIVKYRQTENKRGEEGLISTSKTDLKGFEIVVTNKHRRAMDLVVLDQVPVSRNDKILVELITQTPPSKRDVDGQRGVLAWELRLAPQAQKTVRFGYRVTWPSKQQVRYAR
ncbi:MAG: mucoidy inhibitor MuiA family protein [Pseudomonadota bacterium]